MRSKMENTQECEVIYSTIQYFFAAVLTSVSVNTRSMSITGGDLF